MLTRITTAVIAIVFGIIVLILSDTVVFYFAVAAVSGLIIYEIFHAKDYLRYKSEFSACFAFATLLPFFYIEFFSDLIGAFIFVLALILFSLLIFNHKELHIDDIIFMIGTTVLVSFSMCTLILIKNRSPQDGAFYFAIAMASAWIADAGAYFIGTFFGKHKLCPDISPKKTIEGAVGGIVTNVIILVIVAMIYNYCTSQSGTRNVNYIFIIVYAIITAVVSIVGDLVASLLKRQCNIKDFGKIMPGHGGALDRFDSVLFVAPLTAILLKYFTFFY